MQRYTPIEIARIARKTVKKYGTSNPFHLCEDMGICVKYMDLGRRTTSIKAMLVVHHRVKCIIINENLPYVIQYFIVAHEIGHAILHSKKAIQFTDTGLFDNTADTEQEAHIFAAELLLGDSDELLNDMLSFENLTMYQLAAAKNVPYELLAYKFGIMKEEGYKIPNLPENPKSGFMLGMLGMNKEYNYWDGE